MKSKNEIRQVVRHLLAGADIATFELWGDFSIRLELSASARETTDAMSITGLVPAVFLLRLRSEWWTGQSHEEWQKQLSEFWIKGRDKRRSADPFKAAMLAKLLGTSIADAFIQDDGTLTLLMQEGDSLVIPGKGGAWEESWILELPADDPDYRKWAFVCDADGEVAANWPGSITGDIKSKRLS